MRRYAKRIAVAAALVLVVTGGYVHCRSQLTRLASPSLAEDAPPEMKVEGKGLDARVTLRPASPQAGRGQTVSFDGVKIAVTR